MKINTWTDSRKKGGGKGKNHSRALSLSQSQRRRTRKSLPTTTPRHGHPLPKKERTYFLLRCFSMVHQCRIFFFKKSNIISSNQIHIYIERERAVWVTCFGGTTLDGVGHQRHKRSERRQTRRDTHKMDEPSARLREESRPFLIK